MSLISLMVTRFREGGLKKVFKSVKRHTKKTIIRCVNRIWNHFTKIDDKKVVFISSTGNFDCNPKWICKKMMERGLDVKYSWIINEDTNEKNTEIPPSVKLARRYTKKTQKELASAKVIIDNSVAIGYLEYTLKPEQILIETWHGSLGIKRFDKDTNNNWTWIKAAEREAKMTDFLISNSSFENDIYRNSFWSQNKILTLGHARNDILFAKDEVILELDKKIRGKYEIPTDYKLCLYAPTFRDDGDISPYTINYNRLMEVLSKRFGGKWAVLTKFHPFLVEKLKSIDLGENVYNVSTYVDIQEILCVIEAGITDYSSWICEYIHRRKPGFIFATDEHEYVKKDREFFFPLRYMPFPVANTEDELIENIAGFDNEKYLLRCDSFLAEMSCVDDGHAAERIVDQIEQLL